MYRGTPPAFCGELRFAQSFVITIRTLRGVAVVKKVPDTREREVFGVMVIASSGPPARCPFCGAAEIVAAARVVQGAVVRCWRCGQCDREWAVKPQENHPDRRIGPQDRRAKTRADRRTRKPE